MSEVWTATDLELDRAVAVKLLAPDADPARFDREARAAAGLAHPNVCALYDYGLDEGRRFMVLEYLPGGSLEERLAAGVPLADDATRRVAAEVAAGLAHAHERGVVHRDLKPSNILFDAEGRAKIADFGIARAAGEPGLTVAGTILGTAAYISPEQAAGRQATPASDVYSFGVILFRMLTGRLPFESPDAFALAAMHRDLPAPPVSDLRPDAPPLLESVAAASLSKSPTDRPRDGGALVAELGAAAPADDSTASTVVIAPAPPARRRRLAVVLAGAAVALAGVGLAMALTIGNGTPPAPPATTPPPVTHSSPSVPTGEPPGTEVASTETTEQQATETTEPTTSTTRPAATSAESATTTPTTAQTTTAPVTTTEPTTSAPATTTTEPATTEPTTADTTTTEPAATDTTGATTATTTTPTTPPG